MKQSKKPLWPGAPHNMDLDDLRKLIGILPIHKKDKQQTLKVFGVLQDIAQLGNNLAALGKKNNDDNIIDIDYEEVK